jgi:uncharacterized protein (TIGR03435 family)
MNPKNHALVVCLLAWLATAIQAGSQDGSPQFEIASIYPSPPASGSNMRGGFIRGNRYELYSATIVDLISAAYGVQAEKVIGGPGWLDSDRFEVIAKVPANTTPEALRPMLQALLEDRFKLVIHMDTRPFPQYVLKAGKSSRLKESTGGGESGCRPPSQNGQSQDPGETNVKISCHDVTMAQFANRLPQIAGNYFQLNQVMDLTGLKGSWDFTLQWTRRNLLATSGGSGISIYDALDKQLGLKLEVENIQMPVVVVDGANEKPTENQPGVSRSLPAVPTEFDVAAIKLSAPGSGQRSLRREPSGQVYLLHFTLRELIKFAWKFQDLDVIDNDEMLVGLSKWAETTHFDIIAKPGGVGSFGPRMGSPIDMDSVRLMLRALLANRFKLAAHNEDQPVPVYALVAAKPKLKKADSSMRPGCRNTPAPPSTAEALPPLFSVVCQNTTMAQLVEKLQQFGGIYITHPVIDMTGLEGAWDFALSWSPPHLLGRGDSGPLGETGPGAIDPNGGLTIVEALDKQLGLKLKLQRHPMPVLVVDSVAQKPTDN